MSKYQFSNSTNPLDYIIPNTDIFIMPVMVLSSTNIQKKYVYNIRYGNVVTKDKETIVGFDEEKNPIYKTIKPKILTDHIEDGESFCGGFKTLEDVLRFAENEFVVCKEISHYSKLGMYEKAYEVWQKQNPNKNKQYNESQEFRFIGDKWDKIAIAWEAFVNAFKEATPIDNLKIFEQSSLNGITGIN